MAIEKDPERQQCSPGNLESCTPCEITDKESDSPNDRDRKPTSAFHQLGILDRFLAIWIFLAMVVGIILGNFVPNTGPALERGKFVGVSIPIGKYIQCLPEVQNQKCSLLISFLLFEAVGLLVMMYPILCKVRYETLHRSFRQKSLWIQVGFSIVVNWIIAPFFMVCVHCCLGGYAWICANAGHSLHWHGPFFPTKEISERV